MFAKASGLLRSAFRVGLNFFFGSLGPALSAAAGAGDAAEAADLLLPAKIGSGKRNMVTLGSLLNLRMCSSKGGLAVLAAATMAPVKHLASSDQSCLSALISCSSVSRMSRRRRSVEGGHQLIYPLCLTVPTAQADLVQGQCTPLQTPLQL